MKRIASVILLLFATASSRADLIDHSFLHRVHDGGDSIDHTNTNTQAMTSDDGTVTYSVPYGTYSFRTTTAESPLQLSARAMLDVQVNQLGTNSPSYWEIATAQASARSSIVDVARVEGVPENTTGTVVFSWAITGWSQILLNTDQQSIDSGNAVCNNPAFPCNQIRVLEESASVSLTSPTLVSIVPPFDGILLDDVAQYPGTTGMFPGVDVADNIYDVTTNAATGALIFYVDFTSGENIAVEFDLDVSIALNVGNSDATSFRALIDANYGNTATLMAVDILDASGELVPNAYLSSVNGGPSIYPVSVPEPSAFCLLGVVALVMIGKNRLSAARNVEGA